jgi:hypothetical protein
MERLHLDSGGSGAIGTTTPSIMFSSNNDYGIGTGLLTPTKQQALARYNIEIKFLSKGCIVTVGCKQIAFSNTDDAINALTEYFSDPNEAYKKWINELI